MVKRLYSIFIRLMIGVIQLRAFGDEKSSKMIAGRKSLPSFDKKSKPRVLVHCASLGEFEQAKPIIEKLHNAGKEIILSFFSPSGYEPAKNYPLAEQVIYLPFDTKTKIKRFLKEAQFDLIIIVKYEFWWNLIELSSAPVIFISTAFRTNHYLLQSYSKSLRSVLQKAEHIFLIDEKSKELLDNYDFQNHSLAGDTRIESIVNQKLKNETDEVLKSFIGGEKSIIFGSTYSIEHEEIVRIADNISSYYKLLIFPHEIDKREIFELKDRLGKQCMLYSDYIDSPIQRGIEILIIDQIGLLKDAYRLCSLAYIGGGFNHSIHNILEPFVHKTPLIFGPKYSKFTEANYLIQFPFIRSIDEIAELESSISMMTNPSLDTSRLDEAYAHLFDYNNASEIILKYIAKLI